MRRIPLAALALACSMAMAGCLHAPMPWSPDGQVAGVYGRGPADRAVLKPGWIFESPTTALATPGPRVGRRRIGSGRPGRRLGRLGAPGRVEAADHGPGLEPRRPGPRLSAGRRALNQTASGGSRLWSSKGRPGGGSSRAGRFPRSGPRPNGCPARRSPGALTADILAIPQLNPLGMAIVRADNGRQVNAINDAFLPSWSPDGSRLAFYLRGAPATP